MKNKKNAGFRVGITGGIGSGKSTVCRIFETLGIPVYDADFWAKWLLNHDSDLRKGVIKIFGEDAYSSAGEYDRTFVAKAAFGNPEKLAALNAIAHPAVEKHSRAWHEAKIAEGYPYTIKEAALIIESGGHQHLDYLIVVTAPEPLRIQRVLLRDGVTEDQVRARMAHQLPDSDKIALADAVIVNDGEHSLVQQVWKVHQKLL
jgi:dephospho-CoA kinase